MPWTDHRIIAFDTETTGLNPFDGDRVMEFGAVELQIDAEFRISGVKAHDWLINPGVPIPREVTRVTGITDEHVANKPPFSKMAKEIQALLDGAIVIAHNLAFDLAFLRLELERCDLCWPITVAEVDTLHLSRAKLTEQRRHNLGHIAKLFGVPLDNAHRATDDAEACGRVFAEFCKRYNAPQETQEMIIWADAVGPPPDTGHIGLSDTGLPVFLEGQFEGNRVDQHPDHLQWMTMALERRDAEWHPRYPPEIHEWAKRWLRARASGRFEANPRGGGPRDWGLDPAPCRVVIGLLLVACGSQNHVEPEPSAPSTQAVSAPTMESSAPASENLSNTTPPGATDWGSPPTQCPDGMLPVPGGRFVMGQSAGDAGSDERFVHLVKVSGFCMDRTEVSQPGTNRPITGVSWAEAQAACEARGARLPTEAEWEKAARGGCERGSDPSTCDAADAPLFPWGNQNPTCSLANHSLVGPRGPKRCTQGPGAVDGQPDGAGPYGHLNLAGNVWEYVLDGYHPAVYRPGRPDNPGGPKEARHKVLRGGAWDTFSTNMRVSNRFNDHLKGSTIGFRCVRNGAEPVLEDIAPVDWREVKVSVRQKSGEKLKGRWLVVTAFDAVDIDAVTGLPQPGRSPTSEMGVAPDGTEQMEIRVDIPEGSTVRFSAALDAGPTKGGHPSAASGGIGWAKENYTVSESGPSGITLVLAPLPAHPHIPTP